MSNYELYHHGILGMKWGIRRYQNPDGTLTQEGKIRYKTNSKFAEKYDKDQAKRRKKEEETWDKARDIMNKKKLPEINRKWDKVDLTKDSKALELYEKDVMDTYNKTYNDLVKSEKTKSAIKVGAAVVGTALVAAGGYYLYKSGKLDNLIDKGRDILTKSNNEFDKQRNETVRAKTMVDAIKKGRASRDVTGAYNKLYNDSDPEKRRAAYKLQDTFAPELDKVYKMMSNRTITPKEASEKIAELNRLRDRAAKKFT